MTEHGTISHQIFPVIRIKIDLIDRLNKARIAYLYFTKNDVYSRETVDAFIKDNQLTLFGTTPTRVEEDVVFDNEPAVHAHVNAATGPAWDPEKSALHILPVLTIN